PRQCYSQTSKGWPGFRERGQSPARPPFSSRCWIDCSPFGRNVPRRARLPAARGQKFILWWLAHERSGHPGIDRAKDVKLILHNVKQIPRHRTGLLFRLVIITFASSAIAMAPTTLFGEEPQSQPAQQKPANSFKLPEIPDLDV